VKAAIKRFDEGTWKRDLTLPSSSARKTTVISKLSSVAQELPDLANVSVHQIGRDQEGFTQFYQKINPAQFNSRKKGEPS